MKRCVKLNLECLTNKQLFANMNYECKTLGNNFECLAILIFSNYSSKSVSICISKYSKSLTKIETDFKDKVFRGVTVVAYLPGLEAYPGLEIVQPRVGSPHLVTTHALLL